MSTDNLPALRFAVGEIAEMAKNVSRSRLFGMDEAQTFTLMLLAQSKGLHPIQAVERYHIIKGRPSMKADAMLAEFQAHGGIVEWHQHDHLKCEATFTCPGVKTPTTISWSIEDAKKAALTASDMYTKYPRQMLRSRVISEGIRMTMPGIICGIYTPEEVSDFEPVQARATLVDDRPTSSGAPMASTKDARRFEETLNDYCARVNAKWFDKHTDGSTGECMATELVNTFQIVNHMLKTAGIVLPDGGKFNDRMRTAAGLWLNDESGVTSGWREYVSELAAKATPATIEPEDESQDIEADDHDAVDEAEELALVGREPGSDDE